ncbi:hypothetical protein [Evansella halocellulosilytica]|uniref:hypothetical protein n=1 Tax=Evansella halocellulosilytica TaxID=2011013 RepID=UPI000BB84085|nr:hypothetical protein [Evansella halocellulosilytica]
MDKKKQEKKKKTEIEKVDIPEIEHETPHPGTEEFNLQNGSYDPGENQYLNEQTGTEDKR